MAKADILEAMTDLGLTLTSEFVPWSASRHYVPDAPLDKRDLNWRVTLHKDGRPILTTDYSAGLAHAPSYPQRLGGGFTLTEAAALEWELEHGLEAVVGPLGVRGRFRVRPITPDPADVVCCLMNDARVLDFPSFEAWAEDIGSDPDSRKAEEMYHLCLRIALQLRAGVGEAGLARLQKACEDY